MGRQLTEARVAGDLDVLSRGGLTLDEFLEEAVTAVQRVVPWTGACVGTHDPATVILTSGRKYGALADINTHDDLFAQIEYSGEEPSSFRALAQSPPGAVSMHTLTEGDVRRSERMDRLLCPIYGFSDELRVLLQDGAGVWGSLALMRESSDSVFTPADVDYMASLAEAFARGIRSGIMARLVDSPVVDVSEAGPAVVMFDANDDVVRMSLGAEERLADLNTAFNRTDPVGIVLGLVQAARAVAREKGAKLPRARARTASGTWLVLHSSPLAGRDGTVGDVVVTIEEARPAEILELVAAAFGLTAREREVTRMVLRGIETKAIAAAMHVSAYTVQDHLKAVFDKTASAAGANSSHGSTSTSTCPASARRSDRPGASRPDAVEACEAVQAWCQSINLHARSGQVWRRPREGRPVTNGHVGHTDATPRPVPAPTESRSSVAPSATAPPQSWDGRRGDRRG